MRISDWSSDVCSSYLARAGSSRAPHWTGGGVTHAPKPRDYAQRTPKKMIRLALKSALSDRAANDRVIVPDWGLDAPSTKGQTAALAANGVTRRALVVLRPEAVVLWKCLRNLGDVPLLRPTTPIPHDAPVSLRPTPS